MNRLLSGLLIVIIAGVGCTNKDEAPGDVISKEKMQAVLWDIVQAERFTATYLAKDSSKNIKLENFKLYDQIFSIHKIDKDEFVKSYEFYMSRPDIARVLFDSLAAKANRVREDLYKTPIQNNLPDSAAKPADSLKPADSPRITPAAGQDTNAIRRRSPLLRPLPQMTRPDTAKALKPAKPASNADSSLRPLRFIKPDTSKGLLKKRLLLRNNQQMRDSLRKRSQ